MAIPPISNNPLLRLFRTDRQGADDKGGKEEKTDAARARQDIVEISAAAQQRLDGVHSLSNPDEARETAEQTRTILEGGGQTLGLKADFTE